MIWIALLLLAAACAYDAQSTIDLIGRGGYEKTSAWIIGKYPSATKVWAWVFAFPVVVAAAALYWMPAVWPGVALAAIIRAMVARRNTRL